jgi:oligopeptide/dipeptide ABC transporter ATP-binding protein
MIQENIRGWNKMTKALLEVSNLKVDFHTEAGIVEAVNDVSFEINRGETLGLVGESGCGKSVTALSLLRLIPHPPGEISGGKVLWEGRDLLKLPLPELISIRGREIGTIFQEPLTGFNPVQPIGPQISEVLSIHTQLNPIQIKERVLEMLNRVGLSDPRRSYEAYPHELSGGMRQRAMIAMALICQPQLVIADEPTTALDVTIQAQILDLLFELQTEFKMSVLLITHNLGIVAGNTQKVAVMYAGKIVEFAPVREVFKDPLHPYTAGLLASIPKINQQERLEAIPGMIPNPLQLPKGCHFEPRCPKAMERCGKEYPFEKEVTPGHWVRCWRY